jgi:hypothetical protein
MLAMPAEKNFDFRAVIPCHFRAFPLLAQSAEGMDVPGADVVKPEIMQAIEV